mgnify:FL=1
MIEPSYIHHFFPLYEQFDEEGFVQCDRTKRKQKCFIVRFQGKNRKNSHSLFFHDVAFLLRHMDFSILFPLILFKI